jgi:hypothetical protein
LLTERNLAATLQFIDRSDADDSPMLTVPLGNHGRGGRPIFAGSGGIDQFKLLRNWVRRIAAESPSDKKAANPSGRSGEDFAESRDARNQLTPQSGQQLRMRPAATHCSKRFCARNAATRLIPRNSIGSRRPQCVAERAPADLTSLCSV